MKYNYTVTSDLNNTVHHTPLSDHMTSVAIQAVHWPIFYPPMFFHIWQMLEKGPTHYHKFVLKLIYEYLKLSDRDSSEIIAMNQQILSAVEAHIKVCCHLSDICNCDHCRGHCGVRPVRS